MQITFFFAKKMHNWDCFSIWTWLGAADNLFFLTKRCKMETVSPFLHCSCIQHKIIHILTQTNIFQFQLELLMSQCPQRAVAIHMYIYEKQVNHTWCGKQHNNFHITSQDLFEYKSCLVQVWLGGKSWGVTFNTIFQFLQTINLLSRQILGQSVVCSGSKV